MEYGIFGEMKNSRNTVIFEAVFKMEIPCVGCEVNAVMLHVVIESGAVDSNEPESDDSQSHVSGKSVRTVGEDEAESTSVAALLVVLS